MRSLDPSIILVSHCLSYHLLILVQMFQSDKLVKWIQWLSTEVFFLVDLIVSYPWEMDKSCWSGNQLWKRSRMIAMKLESNGSFHQYLHDNEQAEIQEEIMLELSQ